MKPIAVALMLAALAASSAAVAAPLKPELAGIGFLVGDWSSGKGQVADTGGTSSGRSSVTAEVGGGALLRRDHTDLFDAAGKPAGGFDLVMLIYPESGTLHADYADGEHVIHYTSAVVKPGESVSFLSAAPPGAPVFRLDYALAAPDRLTVTFSMARGPGADFHPIATGSLIRAR